MPTITPYSDDDPSPRARIDFSSGELSGSVSTITVLGSAASGEWVVLSGRRIDAVGGATVTDFLVPLGQVVSYRAEQFDSSGVSLGLTSTATTQIDIDPSNVIIQDPLAPKNAVRVDADSSFGGNVHSQRELQLYRRGFDTIALMGEKGLLEDIPVRVNTRTAADAEMLTAILSEAEIVVRSMPAATVLPPVLHVVIPDPIIVPVDVQWGGSWVRWDMTGFEVSPSTLDIIVPVLTYQRYMDYYATYGAAMADYTTYLDAKLNPPPEA